ncbi:hypothetical protein ACJJTC_005332 [Scirpophaga incertulas]
MIRIEANYKNTSWVSTLWKLQLVLNITKQKTIQTSPLKILIGIEATTPVLRSLHIASQAWTLTIVVKSSGTLVHVHQVVRGVGVMRHQVAAGCDIDKLQVIMNVGAGRQVVLGRWCSVGSKIPSRISVGNGVPSRFSVGSKIASRISVGNGVPSRFSVGSKIPSRISVGNGVPSRFSVGSKIPSRISVGNGVPSRFSVGSKIPSRISVGNGVPSRFSVGSKIPSRISVGNGVPSRFSVGSKIPSRISVGNGVPSRRSVGSKIPSLISVGNGVPSRRVPYNDANATELDLPGSSFSTGPSTPSLNLNTEAGQAEAPGTEDEEAADNQVEDDQAAGRPF